MLDNIGRRASAHYHDFAAACIAFALDHQGPTRRCLVDVCSVKGFITAEIFTQRAINIEIRLYSEGTMGAQEVRSKQLKIVDNLGARKNRKVAPPNRIEEAVGKFEATPSGRPAAQLPPAGPGVHAPRGHPA